MAIQPSRHISVLLSQRLTGSSHLHPNPGPTPGAAKLPLASRAIAHAENHALRAIRRFSCLLIPRTTGHDRRLPLRQRCHQTNPSRPSKLRSAGNSVPAHPSLRAFLRTFLLNSLRTSLRNLPNIKLRRQRHRNPSPPPRSSSFPVRPQFPFFMRACSPTRFLIGRVSSKRPRFCLLLRPLVES